MGQHDKYGKEVLKSAFGERVEITGQKTEVQLGNKGRPARIDAVIDGEIAVEIESRTGKQVRGAIIDLLISKHKKMLLILLPVHMSNAEITKAQCKHIFKELNPDKKYEVIVFEEYRGKIIPEVKSIHKRAVSQAVDRLKGL